MKQILTAAQVELLKIIAKSNLKKQIYFTGGTALAEFYFRHRLSTDLDFFCDDIIDPHSLNIFLKTLADSYKIKKIDVATNINRTQFAINNIKVEIVYFPFKSLGKKKDFMGLHIDSLKDLCTNKTLATYQRTEPKDIFDLYFILTTTAFSLKKLQTFVAEKFAENINLEILSGKIQAKLKTLDQLKVLSVDKNIIPQIKKYFTESSRKYFFSILL